MVKTNDVHLTSHVLKVIKNGSDLRQHFRLDRLVHQALR